MRATENAKEHDTALHLIRTAFRWTAYTATITHLYALLGDWQKALGAEEEFMSIASSTDAIRRRSLAERIMYRH